MRLHGELGHADTVTMRMMNFNGGTTVSGTSIASLGMYVGFLLLHAGDIAIAICFLVLTTAYFVIIVTTLIRYVINYRRNRNALRYHYKLIN